MSKHLHAGYLEVGDELPEGRIAVLAKQGGSFGGPWPVNITLQDGRRTTVTTADKLAVRNTKRLPFITGADTIVTPVWEGREDEERDDEPTLDEILARVEVPLTRLVAWADRVDQHSPALAENIRIDVTLVRLGLGLDK